MTDRRLLKCGRVGVSQPCIGRGERGILAMTCSNNSAAFCALEDASPIDQRTRLQVQLVRLQIGVVAPLASAQRQSKLVDDRPRDLVLNGEDVLELPIEPLGPQGNIAGDLDQLGVDPQLASPTA